MLTMVWSEVCPWRCQCPQEPPRCGPDVPLILDDCACCLVCARQRGEPCSEPSPCDTRRGLRCDYSADVHKRTGVCAGKPALLASTRVCEPYDSHAAITKLTACCLAACFHPSALRRFGFSFLNIKWVMDWDWCSLRTSAVPSIASDCE